MPFTFESGGLGGLVVVHPRLFPDERGFFLESYKASAFEEAGITPTFRQDNHSASTRGVLRGLHYQLPPFEQGKLVRVLEGTVWDVAVDLRPGSPTFRQWWGIELSAENHTMFYIPPGFAHGFVTLSERAQFFYKCTNEYHPESERGIRWDDPVLSVDWPLERAGGEAVVSDRDAALPPFADAELFPKEWPS